MRVVEDHSKPRLSIEVKNRVNSSTQAKQIRPTRLHQAGADCHMGDSTSTANDTKNRTGGYTVATRTAYRSLYPVCKWRFS